MLGIRLNIFLIIFISISFLYSAQELNDDDWNYNSQSDWNSHFKMCNGSHESPINIDTTKVKIDRKMKIGFHHYEHLFHKSRAQNNGHTIRVFLHKNPRNEMPFLTGSAVNNEKFILDSFHFHWGLNDFNGSEHSVNNVKRSAELHLVHWNKIYGNMSNAMDREDGLVVVTVFIETKVITDFGVIKTKVNNEVLTPIVNVLPHIRNFGKNSRIKAPLELRALLPNNTELFYKYQGSLTTPPCSETATFIIFANPIYFNGKQLSHFRRINGEPINGLVRQLTHNTREQMPINDRIVYVSDPYSDSNTNIK